MSFLQGRRSHFALTGVAVVAALAVGALGAVLLLPEPVPAGLESSGPVGDVAVTSQVFDGERRLPARPEIADERLLVLRAAGTVTATHCQPGHELTSGSAAIDVDGQTVIVLSTDVPLWRDLAAGMQGDDVRAVQSELARLGHNVPVTGRYGAATQTAVRRLLSEGPREPGALPLDRVIWLSEPAVTPAECPLDQGATVQPGDKFATIAGGLVALHVNNPPGGNDWIASYDNLTAPLHDGVITDPAFLAAVAGGPELSAVLAQGSGQIEIHLRLAEPIDVAVVPPSAIAVTGEGHGCVIADGSPTTVRIVGSTLGQTMIQFDTAPRAVTAQFPDDAACP